MVCAISDFTIIDFVILVGDVHQASFSSVFNRKISVRCVVPSSQWRDQMSYLPFPSAQLWE
jgi:hypothetical protein